MILEVAILNIKVGLAIEFESQFEIVTQMITAMNGYIAHQLKKCVEIENQYLVLVHWQTFEDHKIGFRTSEAHQEWKKLLHHFYKPFPTVLHYC